LALGRGGVPWRGGRAFAPPEHPAPTHKAHRKGDHSPKRKGLSSVLTIEFQTGRVAVHTITGASPVQEYRVVLMLPVHTTVHATHPKEAADLARNAVQTDYPNLRTPPLLISVENIKRPHETVLGEK